MSQIARTPLPRRSAADDVALYIRDLIWAGRLHPGDRIPQDEVADVLGVSRMPVREALISLESAGLVTTVLHRGAFVSRMSPTDVADHYDLYGVTYGLAVQRGVERGGDAVVGETQDMLERLHATADPDEVLSLVLGFTRTVVAAADSARLASAVRNLEGMVPGNFFAVVPGSTDVARSGLERCAAAMRAGDAVAAGDACRSMMVAQGELVLALLRDRSLLG